MANINLTRQPSNLHFIDISGTAMDISLDPHGTPMLFEFRSDITGAESKASIYWVPYPNANIVLTPYALNVGSTFTISGETFTASLNPGQNEFLAANTTIPQINRAIEDIAEQINSNPNLNWKYTAIVDMTNPQFFLHLVAKNAGSAFSFTVASTNLNNEVFFNQMLTTLTPRSDTFFSNSPGTNNNRGQLLENYNYQAFVEIWKINQTYDWGTNNPITDSEQIADLSLSWTNDNRFIFDFSKYLQPYSSIPLPTTVIPVTGQIITTAIVPYYFKWGEAFNGGFDINTGLPVDPNNDIQNTYIRKYYIDQSEVRYAAPGVFPLANNPPNFNLNWVSFTSGTNPLNYLNTPRKAIRILSNQPSYKLRRRMPMSDAELCYFYVFNDAIGDGIGRKYYLKLTYTFIDNSSATRTIQLLQFTEFSNLYLLDTSISKMFLNAQETSSSNRVVEVEYELHTLIRDSIGVVDVDAILSTWNYSIDLNYEPLNYLKVYWRNPYGVFDQFEFEGLQIDNINVNPIPYSKSLSQDAGYNRYKINKGVFTNKTQKLFTINTGWIDDDHYTWLQELLQTTEIYILDTYTNTSGVSTRAALAMNLVNYEWELNENETQFNLTIQLTPSPEENSLIS